MEPAVRHAENLAEVSRRGAKLSSDSRLTVVRCVECHCQCLYDEGTDRMFVDALDLERVWHDGDRPCPGCGIGDWAFEDLLAEEWTEIERGPWAWCFWSPPPARPTRGARRILFATAVGALAILGAIALAANPDPLAAPGGGRSGAHVPAHGR